MRGIFFLALAWPFSVFAFPVTNHYRVTTGLSELGLDSPSHWDSEASSDYLTYQRPIAWEAASARASQTYDFTLGSIGSKHFLYYSYLKIQKPLSDDLSVTVQWITERDFEADRAELPIELKYRLSALWAVSAFGMPSLYKSENDMGGSVYLTPAKEWEIRYSQLWGDFDRKKRSVAGESWARAPVARTLSARWLNDDTYLNMEVHHQPKAMAVVGGVVTEEISHAAMLIAGQRRLPLGHSLGCRILYDRSFGASAAQVPTERRRALHQLEYTRATSLGLWTPGLNYYQREIREARATLREWLPTLWYATFPSEKPWGILNWHFGYEMTESSWDFEHRLNVKSALKFKHAGELNLLFTFDLDRFGGGETWEGGAGQFRMEF